MKSIFLSPSEAANIKAKACIDRLKEVFQATNVSPLCASLTDRTVIGATLRANVSLNLQKVYERVVYTGMGTATIVDGQYIKVIFK